MSKRTARATLAGLVEAIHNGGPPGCTGAGVTRTSSNRYRLPANENRSPVHARRRISAHSSVYDTRCERGMPNAANSCGAYPRPRPSSMRPPDSWSSTATSSARRSGWAKGASAMSVEMRMRLVIAAAAPATGTKLGR